MIVRSHTISSAGLSIIAREHSLPGQGRPHVVLVHGYPDQQDMWDPVVEQLGADRFHLITYDVRGAGGSGVPDSQDGYRTELLVEDLVAVVRETVPAGEPFHLVGHDWGSVQGWDVVAAESQDERLRGRVASYTSISGPSLDHVAAIYRDRRGRAVRLWSQAYHSWYVLAFHVPRVPELIWTRLTGPVAKTMARMEGRPGHGHWGPELGRNGANGLGLYRANVRRRLRRPGRTTTDLPVLLVVPTRDRFVTPAILEDIGRHCSDLRRAEVEAGHWVTTSHPRQVAELVAAHVHASHRDGQHA